MLNGDSNFWKSDNSNVKENNHINKENFEIDAKLRERVQNIFLRHDIDFTDLLWEILISKLEIFQVYLLVICYMNS